MELIWNGHACFTIKSREGTLVTDPYAPGSVPGFTLPSLTADRVCCSHSHADHGAAERVSLSGRPCEMEVEQLHTFHDGERGALRGENTIHIIRAEGMKLAHMGDIGCELTEEQAAALTGLDALLLPVGGIYTIDARQAWQMVQQLRPRVVIPMHYRGEGFGYEVLSPVGEFLALADLPVETVGNSLELTPETPSKIVVFTL